MRRSAIGHLPWKLLSGVALLSVGLFGCVDPQELETLKQNQRRLIQSFDRIERKIDQLNQPAAPKTPPTSKPRCPPNADSGDLASLDYPGILRKLSDPCSGLSCTLMRRDLGSSLFRLQWGAQKRMLSVPSMKAGALTGHCTVFN